MFLFSIDRVGADVVGGHGLVSRTCQKQKTQKKHEKARENRLSWRWTTLRHHRLVAALATLARAVGYVVCVESFILIICGFVRQMFFFLFEGSKQKNVLLELHSHFKSTNTQTISHSRGTCTLTPPSTCQLTSVKQLLKAL